jgi:uncharacterized cupredoxin-like copper-binding protein
MGAVVAFTTAAAAPAKVDWAKARPVTVVAVDYRFVPNRLMFRHGLAYRLILVNRGKEVHELTAPKFFMAIEMRNPDALNPERTQIEVQPGAQKDLYFVARRPGRFAMWCADHDWAGMTGDITVK